VRGEVARGANAQQKSRHAQHAMVTTQGMLSVSGNAPAVSSETQMPSTAGQIHIGRIRWLQLDRVDRAQKRFDGSSGLAQYL
jgi:hypothetical protein